MIKLLFFIVSITTIAVSSCRPARKIQSAIAKKDTLAIAEANELDDSLQFMNEIYSMLDSNRIEFETFSAKINVEYVDADDKRYDVNAFVRMQRDSAIWISVNAIFGIEALRALITKDSVKIIDKHNKVYTARALNYLQEVVSLPLDLATLQDLIIGNPVFVHSQPVSYTRTSDYISLLIVGDLFKNLLTLNASNSSLVRSKLDDTDITRNRTCDLTYSDYENKKGVMFSTARKISIAEKKKLDIKLDFKQYEFNEPLTFPFSIPRNYQSQ